MTDRRQVRPEERGTISRVEWAAIRERAEAIQEAQRQQRIPKPRR